LHGEDQPVAVGLADLRLNPGLELVDAPVGARVAQEQPVEALHADPRQLRQPGALLALLDGLHRLEEDGAVGFRAPGLRRRVTERFLDDLANTFAAQIHLAADFGVVSTFAVTNEDEFVAVDTCHFGIH
jgi:hypothetical protein